MRAEDITSKPRNPAYLKKTLFFGAIIAFAMAVYVAYPALLYLLAKPF